VSRLLVRPEDLPDHVVTNVAHYRSAMLRILEDYMADHSQQHLIELDANQPVNVLEKVLCHFSCLLSFDFLFCLHYIFMIIVSNDNYIMSFFIPNLLQFIL